MLDARDLPNGQRLTTDICIIGAGAAGITMASEFVGTGIDVLLLESGGLRQERDTQDLNVGTTVDERLHEAPERYRQRRFGGSMSEHESRFAPLAPIDFEARSYMPNSGWPFGPEILASYYSRALTLCESDESQRTFERDRDLLRKPLIEGFDDHHFSTETLDRYSGREPLAKRHGERLKTAGNICVMVNATVTRLQLDVTGSHVESLIFRTLTGKSMTVMATRFVICAGALETARLLLANRDVHPNGIGNDNDNVGRFYMCPPEGIIGDLEVTRPPAAIWYDGTGSMTRPRSRRRMALKPESQRRLQIGRFVARLSALPHDGNAAQAPGLLSRLRPRRAIGNRFSLEFQAEQQVNASSRVTLGDTHDALGMPRLIVDWHCNVGDFETVRIGVSAIAEDLARNGAGRLHYEPSSLAAVMTCRGAHGINQMGTARMGNDPSFSVVDANCRVHGVANLYVAGGAVFPTSSVGDPMLTLVALSIRLSDHLKVQEYQSSPPQPQQARRPTPDPVTAVEGLGRSV